MATLLPASYTNEVRREKIFRLAFLFVVFVCLGILVGIVFMLPSYFAVVFSKNDVLRQLSTQQEVFAKHNVSAIEAEITRVNDLAHLYQHNETGRKSLAPLLLRLSDGAANVKFINLSLQQNASGQFVFALEGIAQKRDDLLAYIERLKKAPEFDSVRSPISNLLRDTNAHFMVEVVLKREYYDVVSP